MSEKKEPAGGVHAGHRSRMRQRFLANSLNGFQDHEVLELLLFYAVPRRDVNAIAHMLIKRFGSFPAVLDASEEELCSIPGVGSKTANFLKLIPEILAQMALQSCREERFCVRTPKKLLAFFEARGFQGPPGRFYLIFADVNYNVMVVHFYDSFEELTVQELTIRTINSRAAMVFMVEWVEDCSQLPTSERCKAISDHARALAMLNIPLMDYYTIDMLGHLPRSFVRTGQFFPI